MGQYISTRLRSEVKDRKIAKKSMEFNFNQFNFTRKILPNRNK
jgi:hypothetical protein